MVERVVERFWRRSGILVAENGVDVLELVGCLNVECSSVECSQCD